MPRFSVGTERRGEKRRHTDKPIRRSDTSDAPTECPGRDRRWTGVARDLRIGVGRFSPFFASTLLNA